MAEIKIERRNRPVWPWILGIILIAIIIWFLLTYFNNEPYNSETGSVDTTTTLRYDVQPVPQDSLAAKPVMDFVNFARADSNQEAENIQSYSAEGIRLLTNALTSIVNRNDSTNTNIVSLRDSLQKNAAKVQEGKATSADFKNSINNASDLMAAIQKENYPNLKQQAERVKMASDAIIPNKPITDQKSEIKDYFSRSAEMLQAITPTTY